MLCIAKEVNLKQTTINHKLRSEMFSQLFYSLFIVFSFKHSLGKAPSLLLIFIRVVEGHTPFQVEALHYS